MSAAPPYPHWQILEQYYKKKLLATGADPPPPTVGQQLQVKDFNKKYFFTEKIIYLSVLSLKIPQWLKSPPF